MAEFKSLVDKMNKQKEFKEELEIEEIQEQVEQIPGVDKPRLQQEISVSGNTGEIANLQAHIDDLDDRVTALENP